MTGSDRRRPATRPGAVPGGVLADPLLEALEILLHGFEAAAGRDGDTRLRDLLARPGDPIHAGLLTVLLRLAFMLHAEQRGLLPVDQPIYAARYGLLALLEHPHLPRPGAWSRLVATWRALYHGVDDGDLHIPARAGDLFDPEAHPWLTGIDDRTVHQVLQRLLACRIVEVEQIGGAHEALMGYRVLRLPDRAVCLRSQRVRRIWITAAELLDVPAARRAGWLQDHAGLARPLASRLAAALDATHGEDEALEVLAAARLRHTDVLAAGRLVLQPGSHRRSTGSHYTPRSLTAPIVRKTLEPLLAALGPAPASQRLLTLKICDPAMGSGAFLLEVVRQLGDQLVAAWTREGERTRVADEHGDVETHARRLVAQRCVHGVDRQRLAVELARLSLWLVVGARHLPFTFVDHALRHGDTLAGLDLEQLRAFHWEPGVRVEAIEALLRRARDATMDDRAAAISRLHLLADLLLGAFFAADRPRAREQERTRRLALVTAWLATGGPPGPELLRLQAQLREQVPTFHWPLEFPEVFLTGTGDALDTSPGMHAFVGNPPFAGKNSIIAVGGRHYLEWLQTMHKGAHGNADLSAHFLRRADTLLGQHGTIGLIATNTIGQGDTRATGLQYLVVRRGYTIHDATRSMSWPEAGAAVTISIVHLARGSPAASITRLSLHDPDPADERALLTRATTAINSRLRPFPERADPRTLARNAGLSFQGSIVLGMGFVLGPDERDALIRRDRRNAARISPYLGGEAINADPDPGHARYVIDFGQMSLAEAERWPDLLDILRLRVKPERDQQRDPGGRTFWWRHLRPRPELHAALRPLTRCLVTTIHTKHLAFSFQTIHQVFSHALVAAALPDASAFATLQSRPHECWARLLSSSLEDRLRYSVTDCFETFPFPAADPRSELPALTAIGERLHSARAEYMHSTRQGLTRTYNALKDPDRQDPALLALRALHRELDRDVLRAYGWPDIEVPPYTTPRTPGERRAHQTFEDTVLDRLFALNSERAAEERRLHPGTRGRG